MSVYLIQCLCPQRHAIVGVAYEADEPSDEREAELKINVAKMIAAKMIDPWCGICKSRDWHYETGKTHYRTMEEAEGPLRENAEMQARVRNFLRQGRN